MWRLIVEKRMPPTRKVRYCCAVLKERKHTGIKLTGIRADESESRENRAMLEVLSKKAVLFHPIFNWTELHVWTYIDSYKLPYPSLYEEEGFGRLGCIGCPKIGRIARMNEFKRWPKYELAYRRAFAKCINKRNKDGLAYKGKHKKWLTPDIMFDWWINEDRRKEAQCVTNPMEYGSLIKRQAES